MGNSLKARSEVHAFEKDVANIYGVNIAIIAYNFRFWLQVNKKEGRNFYEGRHWTYNSCKALAETHTYWSPSQIQRFIKKMLDEGILLKGNFNYSKTNRTSWYSFSDEWLEIYPELKAESIISFD